MMPRGGARPGAGRPRKPLPKAVAYTRGFDDLTDRLSQLPSGVEGLRRRCALALAALNAPLDVIGAVLETDTADLGTYRKDIRSGQTVVRMSVYRAVWALAENGHVYSLIWLLKRLDAMDEKERMLASARRSLQR